MSLRRIGSLRILQFGVTSAAGLACDICVFTLAIYAGVRPGLANLLGGTVAITLVFFCSTRYVFRGGHSFLAIKFSAYVLYQILSMSCYSLVIEALVASFELPPLLAKAIVTPASFFTNYLFMRFLVARRAASAGANA